jgi:hypothetical protein
MKILRHEFDDLDFLFDDQKTGFGGWLKRQVDRDDIVGDLARDAQSEGEGLTCKTVEALWQHIQEKTAQRPGSLGHIVSALEDAEGEFLKCKC